MSRTAPPWLALSLVFLLALRLAAAVPTTSPPSASDSVRPRPRALQVAPSSHRLKLKRSRTFPEPKAPLTPLDDAAAAEMPTVLHRRQEFPTTDRVSQVRAIEGYTRYVAEVDISGVVYEMNVDTGSGNTWVKVDPFVCLDASLAYEINGLYCRFGPQYRERQDVELMDETKFISQYADGSFISGLLGYSDSMTIAGVHLPNVTLGLAETGHWPRGDFITTGLLALGFDTLTLAMNGENEEITYPNIITALAEVDDMPQVFSMALSRDPDESVMSFGGIPPVEVGEFVTTPILKYQNLNPDVEDQYVYYDIRPDMVMVNSSVDPTIGVWTDGLMPVFVVDTGATLTYFDQELALAIHRLFTPPARSTSNYETYYVECDSIPPKIGIQINGQMVYPEPESLIMPETRDPATGLCLSGIAGMPGGGVLVLGDSFLQGLVAVFDVGNKELHFGKRT